MGVAAALVKRHLHRLADGEIFTTRDLLAYGTRSAIDNLTKRLVDKGEIARLARGVFCKTRLWIPSATALEIVTAKMKAWGKKFWKEEHKDVLAEKNKLASDVVVSVAGSSSSFMTYLGVKIVLRARGQRRMRLGESRVGILYRKLWNRERDNYNDRVAEDVIRGIPEDERWEFFKQFRLAPAWLTDSFYRYRMRRLGKDIVNIAFDLPLLPA